MRIHLVTMPWQPIELPSLQVGLLHALLDRTRPDDEVREFHGSLRWAEFLLERSKGALRPGDHVAVGSESIFDGLGDWVFSGVLYNDPEWGVAQLKEYAARRGTDISTATAMRVHAAEFIEESADAILDEAPDVVGFTSTFMQNISSLALAAELKRRRPGLTVVFGGSNCDGPMGHALHRNHRFVDHVVRGEGEYALPALLTHIDAGTAPADVPGLCWWDGQESRANEESRRTVAPADIPSPDYDLWQQAVDASPVAEYVHPKLVVEGARGCWWGEKHHCTFCGLNGSAMTFRAKPGNRLWDEVDRLVRRHRILDIVTVDNIIDMAYFKDFLPLAADSGWDLRMHYEVKSNLTAEQLELLARATGPHPARHREPQQQGPGPHGQGRQRVPQHPDPARVREPLAHLLLELPVRIPGETDQDYASVIDQICGARPPPAARRRPPHPTGAVQPQLRQPRARLPATPSRRDVPPCLRPARGPTGRSGVPLRHPARRDRRRDRGTAEGRGPRLVHRPSRLDPGPGTAHRRRDAPRPRPAPRLAAPHPPADRLARRRPAPSGSGPHPERTAPAAHGRRGPAYRSGAGRVARRSGRAGTPLRRRALLRVAAHLARTGPVGRARPGAGWDGRMGHRARRTTERRPPDEPPARTPDPHRARPARPGGCRTGSADGW